MLRSTTGTFCCHLEVVKWSLALFHSTNWCKKRQQESTGDIFKIDGKEVFKNDQLTDEKSGVDLLGLAQSEISPEKRKLAHDIKNIVKIMMSPHKMQPSSFEKIKTPLIDTKSVNCHLARLFIDSPKEPLDCFTDDETLLKEDEIEELKRKMAYQYCLSMEKPYKKELPEDADQSNFLSTPIVKEQFLSASRPLDYKKLNFGMIKWTAKNQGKRKKLQRRKLREDDGWNPEGWRKKEEDLRNTILPRFGKHMIRSHYRNKMLNVTQFSQPLVIDMRFHDKIDKESSSFYSQMFMMVSRNRSAPNPFHLVLCNHNKDSALYKHIDLVRKGEILFETCTSTKKSYLDMDPLIDRESLVYLSPNSSKIMTEFSHSKIYIIGGLVDCSLQKNASRTIALAENIRCERLPLDLYLNWGGIGGKQELSLDICLKILMTLKDTGSWIEALQHVPYRFHRGLSDMGKELAGHNLKIIEKFEGGKRWLENRGCSDEPKRPMPAYKSLQTYLGR